MFADRGETRFVNLLADELAHHAGLASPRVEMALPLPERAVAIGHRNQADMGDIVEQRYWCFEETLGKTGL